MDALQSLYPIEPDFISGRRPISGRTFVVNGLCTRTGPQSSKAHFIHKVDVELNPDRSTFSHNIWYIGTKVWEKSPVCQGDGKETISKSASYTSYHDRVKVDLQDIVTVRIVQGKTCDELEGLSLKQVSEQFEAPALDNSPTTVSLGKHVLVENWKRGSCMLIGEDSVSIPVTGDFVTIRKGADCRAFAEPYLNYTSTCLTVDSSTSFVFGDLDQIAVLDSKPTFESEFPASYERGLEKESILYIVLGSVFGLVFGCAVIFEVRRRLRRNKTKDEASNEISV